MPPRPLPWLALAALAACGDPPPPAPRTGPAATSIAAAAGPDDVIVAEVEGRPVWGSCVARQARRAHAADRARARRAALDECVAFELLAQAAEARGLAADPEVQEATRTALVDRLVATGFEARYRGPADLAEPMAKVLERNKDQMDRPEGRASAYARVALAKDAPPAEDARARAVAEQIARALAPETGLHASHFEEIARQIAEGTGVELEVEQVPMHGASTLVKPYADALFALPEVGRTSPAVRTAWGWDVILLTDVVPARRYSPEEVAREVFPDVRRGYFLVWVNQLARSLGVKIVVDHQQLTEDAS